MAKTKRNALETARDLELTREYYLKGESQSEIAKRIGVSQQQVSYDIKKLERVWLQSTGVDIELEKMKELARVDQLIREYWIAWEASRVEKTKARQETKGKDKSGKPIVTKTVAEKEQMLGNPAYLSGVLACIAERCRILGVYPVGGKMGAAAAAGASNGIREIIVKYVDDPNDE